MSQHAAEWVAAAPGRRAALPAAVTVLSAAEILHHASVSGTTTGFAAAAVTAITYARTPGRRAAVLTAIGGAWFTLTESAGPLAGSWHPLLITWAAGTIAGSVLLRRCESIRAAREWRQARADWLYRGPAYGLQNTHLIEHEHTRLGETWVVDTTSTGRRASSYIPSDLAERIAEREMLPVARVRVTAAGIAGRIRISIRQRDPWAEAVEHPVLAAEPELDLPVPCSVRDPLPVGIDPETGTPLLLAVWHKNGARNVLITGMKEAGKTVLQNCIRERLTAAEDAVLFDINTSKALEDAEWEPTCDLAAIGEGERKRALGILRLAHAAIVWRGRPRARDTAVFQPTREEPLIVVNIDEIDALIDAGDYLAAAIKRELSYIASKGRSEAVCLIIAGQRATADWIGGANVRANIDLVCVGKVSRAGEARHAGDAALSLPDMATYGAGQPGVWGIAELGGEHQLGRTFNLESPLDLRRLAHERAELQPSLEPGLVKHLGALYAQLKGWETAGAAPAAGHAATEVNGSYPPVADSPVAVVERTPLDALDAEMNEVLSPELHDRLQRMDERAADTRRLLAETDEIIGSLPKIDPAARAASSQDRWKQLAEQTEIPPDIRARILDLLSGDGMSARKIAEEIGETRSKVTVWLNKLRHDGEARTAGKGRAARWVLASYSESGDSQ